MGYTQSTLWNNTLAIQNDEFEERRSELRESYLSARENIIAILDKIRVDFPNLTMHDITHVDSLWEIASTIVGEDYIISP